VLLTPSGFNKGDLTEAMLLRLTPDGDVVEGDLTPTSEKWMHLEFYKQRPKAPSGVKRLRCENARGVRWYVSNVKNLVDRLSLERPS
jgi:ribulose-5-phosphate 4-epimerase/fuculose-1-phosphate aldolase